MSEDPSTPYNGPNMANGTVPDDQLRLEAARKRLKIDRATSETECPLDAQIRRMTKELEELKKQRQVAELQEQIWAEQQLLEASRHRLSIAAASASPKNSPAPTTAPAIIYSPQTAVVSQLVAVQQIQHPKPPVQASIVQAPSTPASMKGKENNTPTQVQPFRVPAVGDDSGMTTSTFTQRPIAVSTSAPENPSQQQQKEQNTHQQTAQQQQQQQRPWFDRPRTPDAPADSTLLQLPPYQGLTREEYTNFISTLEAHFTKAPQYYSKDVEYRKVKIGLEHLIPALRDAWYALLLTATPGRISAYIFSRRWCKI
ncbi:uncharacterized protein N7458_008997 [Penicillium daleae]|uniref:Uncharacterized protein n=1 Tax=Penicillium daleae TaxID=63821 RepID=A0AAD6FYH3_9EURO|nr:uncharacterized protein N7458_008997 [Penicillium daleae]KAJ5437999.1 hypothetical protein N7458_008997 [Penicillium daleae]